MVSHRFRGIYRKRFSVDDADKKYILTFLGAASNMEVYVNGDYVGYSEGSHNTAEFDISDNRLYSLTDTSKDFLATLDLDVRLVVLASQLIAVLI